MNGYVKVGQCLVCEQPVFQDDMGCFHYASVIKFVPGYGSAWDEIYGGRYQTFVCDLCNLDKYRRGVVTFNPGPRDPDRPERTESEWERTERIVRKQVAGTLTDADLER